MTWQRPTPFILDLARLAGFVEAGLPGDQRDLGCSAVPASHQYVVSMRMAKKQQMRWSDEGAHLLAQVRVHEINGDLRPRAVPIPFRPPKPICDPWLDGYEFGEFMEAA